MAPTKQKVTLYPDEHDRIARLCPELRAILDVEVKAGNYVKDTWEGWGFVVMLGRPFCASHEVDPTVLEYRELNDPHHWKAEWHSKRTGQTLACAF